MVVLLCFLSSCFFFGPVDELNNKPIEKSLEKNELVGKWTVDNFTNKLINKKGFAQKDSLVLNLAKNGTFTMKNIPSFFNPNNESSFTFTDEEGSWSLLKEKKQIQLQLSFNTSNLFKSGFSTSLKLYKKDNKILFYYFIGDPDMGERFLFQKVILNGQNN